MYPYYELHIEQGPVLETEEIDIGVVTHGQGLKWLEVELSGTEQHTGTTPMHVRKDTSLAMSEIILAVNNIAYKNQPNALGSVGHIEVSPNSRNVIAGHSIFTIDFRSPDITKLDKMENELKLLFPLPTQLRTSAQLVSFEAAVELLNKTEKIDRPVDTTLQMFWETKIKCYCVNKSGISDHTLEAGGSTLVQKNHSKLKLSRNIKRFVYRIKILYLSKFQNKKI